MNNKIKTYLGFCKKSGKLTVGFNNIEKSNKKTYLIVVDENIGESTLKKLIKISDERNCRLLLCKVALADYVSEECKTVSVGNKSLADAIVDNIDCDFSFYQGGC